MKLIFLMVSEKICLLWKFGVVLKLRADFFMPTQFFNCGYFYFLIFIEIELKWMLQLFNIA